MRPDLYLNAYKWEGGVGEWRSIMNYTIFSKRPGKPNLFSKLVHLPTSLLISRDQPAERGIWRNYVCRRHCTEYCISQGTLSSFLPYQYWAFFSEPAPCHLSNIKSQALLCTAGAFVTAQPLTVLSICLIMTFLFASNLPELLFLSCNSQGMRSLYQFPLNGACMLCKTAWAWYGARV